MNNINLTFAEVRHKAVSFESLENAFLWLQKIGALNQVTARVLSKEAMKRAGFDLEGKELHHRIPLRRRITLETVLNLNNLQIVTSKQHKVLDSELVRCERPICDNKEHKHFRVYKKASMFLAAKYRKFEKDGATVERKAIAFDDACRKLGLLLNKDKELSKKEPNSVFAF